YLDTVRAEFHPLSWYHAFDGGRAFYTALGHTSESYSEDAFVKHALGGLQYAMGLGDRVPGLPPEGSFSKEVLLDSLNEPMELDELPDGRIIYAQRRGEILIVDPTSSAVDTVGVIDVDATAEDGLLGLALDPGFNVNNWIYLFYSRPEKPEQYVSRFRLIDDRVDLSSEEMLVSIPLERGCCHSGGSLAFDPAGNLFISVGDNTNPFQSDGRAPIDERPGQEHWNAQRSAADTKDLRGKILRIRPEPDGGYSIPDGNLFPVDGSIGLAEIYTMGNRNPFRISIDSKTGYLYWGEVGPDANEDDSLRGPRGYDEINQARAAGNFGWPYFIADNEPYHAFDFATERAGEPFDPAAPVNMSRLNKGARELPPAQPAMIWYPYAESPEFPMMGAGGRTSMAGPVFYSGLFSDAPHRFPDFYDGKLFIYDWMRYWIKTVTFDESGDLLRVEDFVPAMEFIRPMDMLFARDGSLYVLEYGTKWSSPNPDARLSRIRYRP
ncbi:MAG TPA: PQQ-dependent sugar dehydrogenase, partial [Rhodothermales bacterium]|nr:PQQ-dependent sugar dehydrogenase [Rhodothermales bacterium]